MSDGSRDAAAYLGTTASLLWGGSSSTELVRASSDARDDGVVREFLVVPSARRPRLVVPSSTPRASAAALRRYSHALGGRERLTRALLAGALRTGLVDRVPTDRLRVAAELGGADGIRAIEDHLARILGVPRVCVSFGVGSPRANQKPVLHALTPDGRSLAFVKVGDTEVAKALVRREAAALEAVGAAGLRRVASPRLLHLGPWNDVDLLVQSALRTPVRRPRRAPAVPLAAMLEVAGVGGITDSPFARTALWERLRAAPAAVLDPADAERLDRLVTEVGDQAGETPRPTGAWHGDWTPWNMAWLGPRLQLWDWERFDPGVPLGFDLVHLQLQDWLTRGPSALTPEPRPDVEPWLQRLGVPDPALVVRLYLVELTSRYLLASQEAIGGPLRDRTRWLLSRTEQEVGR
jgi:hypothetical protein